MEGKEVREGKAERGEISRTARSNSPYDAHSERPVSVVWLSPPERVDEIPPSRDNPLLSGTAQGMCCPGPQVSCWGSPRRPSTVADGLLAMTGLFEMVPGGFAATYSLPVATWLSPPERTDEIPPKRTIPFLQVYVSHSSTWSPRSNHPGFMLFMSSSFFFLDHDLICFSRAIAVFASEQNS